MTNPEDLNADKVRAVIASAVAGLSPQDRAERIEWCRQNDAHGVRMFVGTYDDDDSLEFRWGGRSLLLIPRDALTGDTPIAGTYIPDDASMDAEISDLLGSE
jgi:hypothetical protein